MGEPEGPRRSSSSRLMVALLLLLARRFSMYAFRSFGLICTARQLPKWALRGLRWDRTESKDFSDRHLVVRHQVVQERAKEKPLVGRGGEVSRPVLIEDQFLQLRPVELVGLFQIVGAGADLQLLAGSCGVPCPRAMSTNA